MIEKFTPELFNMIMACESIMQLNVIKQDCKDIPDPLNRMIAFRLIDDRIKCIVGEAEMAIIDDQIEKDGFDTVLKALLEEKGLKTDSTF